MEPEITIEGLDVIDVIKYITKKRNKFLAIVLADIETVVKKDSTEYRTIRKAILDGMNDYTRSLMRVIFGNVEGMNFK